MISPASAAAAAGAGVLDHLPRRNFAGSLIGGIAETQEMLDFCAEHGIVSDIEMIRIDQVNDAYERVIGCDFKYRSVIDMQSLSATT